eukprot:gene13507-41312_t
MRQGAQLAAGCPPTHPAACDGSMKKHRLRHAPRNTAAAAAAPEGRRVGGEGRAPAMRQCFCRRAWPARMRAVAQHAAAYEPLLWFCFPVIRLLPLCALSAGSHRSVAASLFGATARCRTAAGRGRTAADRRRDLDAYGDDDGGGDSGDDDARDVQGMD